jgi:hypothetical protein
MDINEEEKKSRLLNLGDVYSHSTCFETGEAQIKRLNENLNFVHYDGMNSMLMESPISRHESNPI